MADLGNIGRSLSRGLLASSGPSGMAAFASIMNTEKRLATASAEAKINRATKEREQELAMAMKGVDMYQQILKTSDPDTPEGANDRVIAMDGLTQLYSDNPDLKNLAPLESFQAIRPEAGANKPFSTIGKIQADVDAGLITPEQGAARTRKLTHVAPPATTQDKPFGSGIDGRAMATLLDIKNRRDRGEEIPPELINQGTLAEQHLTTPRIVVGADGNRYEYTPGVSSEFSVGGKPAQTIASDEELPVEQDDAVTTPSGATLAPISSKEDPLSGKKDIAAQKVIDVLNLLDKAEKEGEVISGVAGTAKARGGGLARQAGIPVSTMSSKLSRALGTISALMAPILAGEKKLSNEERARFDKLVGTLNPNMDDIEIRETLGELLPLLE